MNSLIQLIDVLFYEGHFTIHDLYKMSLTCVGFNQVYQEAIPRFMKQLSDGQQQSSISFVCDGKDAQITIIQSKLHSLLMKRIQFPMGRNRKLTCCSYFYSGANAAKKDFSQKLDLIIPPIPMKNIIISIPNEPKQQNLVHYLRLQRKQLKPRLTEKMFLKVYDTVVNSCLNNTSVRKALHVHKLHNKRRPSSL